MIKLFHKIMFMGSLMIIAVISGCSKNNETQGTSPIITSNMVKCNDYDRIYIGQYLIENNVWAKGDITDYEQCIWTDQDDTFGWNWRWPSVGQTMKTYPMILYGWTWWQPTFTSSKLPITIKNIREIYVHYDMTVAATGLFNTAFDLWLTSEAIPTRENLTKEIMIWINTTTPNDARFIKRVVVDGEAYNLHVNYDWNAWTYIAFIKETPKLQGSLKLHEFLKMLRDDGYISQSEYLVCIELGNEVKEGIGETTIRNYSIEIK